VAKEKGRKVGRGNSKKWVASGGPTRMAKRKARNHGCDRYQLHVKPADKAHSGVST
jgi:hypothetical protein